MPQQATVNVESNFTKGLITEATALNFPENAATDTDNCEYTLTGDVLRRLGIDYEENFEITLADRAGQAVTTYVWNNVGGDGNTQILVVQIGGILRFYRISDASKEFPMSAQILSSIVDLSSFTASFDSTIECEFTSGNGYLFVFNPTCDPIYCSYSAGTITGNPIQVSIRDVNGIVETGIADNFRPTALTAAHSYNINNQGWSGGNPWSGISSDTRTAQVGSITLTVQAGLSVTLGELVAIENQVASFKGIPAGTNIMTGNVTAYAGTSITINVTSVYAPALGSTFTSFYVLPYNRGLITTWNTAIGNYPSNADVWWLYKDASGVFSPSTTIGNVIPPSSPAGKGHYIVPAFTIDRSSVSGVDGLPVISTTVRPRTGTWFQGRVWYTGTDASYTSGSDFYTWTENIYFSQIVNNYTDFGKCYQTNDPTSETFFDILPTDGGVITIQGAGNIFKLFPVQNGMLVFAANGVWFITGSQGIGFTATDYTITKISNIQSISGSSFVDVLGMPFFWNEEGIYQVKQQQGGGLAVEPITVSTIQVFFDAIPPNNKKYVKGAYNPIEYVIEWIYKDTDETSVTDRYAFNRILSYNVYNKAFFPYSFSTNVASINSIQYISGITANTDLEPMFKYLAGNITSFTLADLHNENYVDWNEVDPTNYESFFITGFKIRGQAIKKFQPQYIQVYSGVYGAANGYYIQGIWDFSNNRNSGRWSSLQRVVNGLTRADTAFRRHKIRGHGYALQFKISSIDGMPFNIQGWAAVDTINAGT